jgi:hypothetical protein
MITKNVSNLAPAFIQVTTGNYRKFNCKEKREVYVNDKSTNNSILSQPRVRMESGRALLLKFKG